jgi:hypothetical protein
MPINIKRGESEKEFISRCIPIEIGYGKGEEQATAICYNVWQNRNMSKTTQQIVNQKIADLSKEQELISPNPCQSGYIAIGLKPKGGRMVPNCVPEK